MCEAFKMVKVAIIATFAMSLFFNVFLNSFDVYSDTALAYKTLTFDLGPFSLKDRVKYVV